VVNPAEDVAELPAGLDVAGEVRVHVDQTREQDVAAQVQRLGAGRDRLRVDRNDVLAVDDDDRRADDRSGLDVEVTVRTENGLRTDATGTEQRDKQQTDDRQPLHDGPSPGARVRCSGAGEL
jgi:hypothetical protein